MLNTPSGGGGEGQLATLQLGALNIVQGQARTIFARLYLQDDPVAETMLNAIGVTDKSLRTFGDVGGDIGPVTRLNDDTAGALLLRDKSLSPGTPGR